MAERPRARTAPAGPEGISTRVDPYQHPIMPGEIGWLTQTFARAIDGMPSETRTAWHQHIHHAEALNADGQGATEALLPSIAMLANWVIETRLRQTLLEGLRRGDLLPTCGPEATSPTFQLTPQGQARAVDVVDYLEQTAVAPLRRGHHRLDVPPCADGNGLGSQPH